MEEYRRLLRFGAYRVRLGYGSPDTRELTITMTTPITTPFKWETTAAEVVAGSDLSGNRVIVTGGASGIGLETARALAAAGAHVTLAVRDAEAGQRVAAEIVASTGNTHVFVAPVDLADPASVASFVAAWDGPLDVLVNNAGVMACPETRTPQGWELQFATNHLGHFALAIGLHHALAAAGGARIVSVSSRAHLRSPVDFDDIHFKARTYEPWDAYAQSKTANVLFAVEATRRWESDGITANALQPGTVRSNLQRYITDDDLERTRGHIEDDSGSFHWKTPEQGAATSVLLAASPLLEGISGRYFEDCNEAGPSQPGTGNGVAAYALDPRAAARLWEISVKTLAS
ncbi:MAG: hypothetical protein QOD59_4376 [Mycobacterium sp.]|jgi:NAD(P)-dependent dehydrogenase (short-subunit alcohol dehydrogenase family)|nr:hypothetical protein [Mycobacterium sp.]